MSLCHYEQYEVTTHPSSIPYVYDGPGTPCYNGNVCSMKWKNGNSTKKRGYKFTYDGANRLAQAMYGEGDALTTYVGRFREVLGYDAHGNVTSIARYRRITSSSYGLMDYNQDHLGNNREVVDSAGTVKQVTNYYPFGAPYADPAAVLNASLQPYKYNGKELDRMHGLDTYDYGARQYDPILGRWDRVDPLCEKYYSVSPYTYCGNNPVNAVDSIGMSYDWVQNQLNKKIEWRDDVTSPNNTPNGYSYIGRNANDILHHYGFTSNVLSQKATLWAVGREGDPSANVTQFKTTKTTALLSLEAVTTIDSRAKTESNTFGFIFSGIKINGSFTQDNITSNPNYSFLYGGNLNAEIQGATTHSNLDFRRGPSLNIPGNVTKEASIFVSQDLLNRGTTIHNVKIDVGYPSTFIVFTHSFKFNIYR